MEKEIGELKKVIEELSDGEAKSLLFNVLLQLNFVKEMGYSERDFVNDVENIYEMAFNLSKERSYMKQEGNFQMIHILFGDSSAGCLRIALKKMGVYQVEKVISFWDMFSIGPVWMLHEKLGQEARFDWMKNVMSDENEDFLDYIKRFQESVKQIDSIQEGVPIIIWISDSSHEQTGLLYVLQLLKNKDNDIMVINTTKKHSKLFNKKDIEYTVLHTGEILPEKLQVIYEQSKNEPPLSQHERESLEKEWLSLSESQETLRIWRNGRIQSVPEDYYDQLIIQGAKYLHRKPKLNGFMKSARLIGHVLGHLEQHVGDSFLEYRLKKLIEAGVFESEGSLEALRFYSVRLKR